MTGALINPTAILVDDDDLEAQRIAARLTEAGLPCQAQHPPKTVEELADSFKQSSPGIVLLDYRLDDMSEAKYRAGTVAALLREKQPQIPIGLVTTEEKLRESVIGTQVRALFDTQILKAALAKAGKDDNIIAVELIDLIDAYQAINALTPLDNWRAISALFSPRSEDEADAILDCHPPVKPATTPSVVHWIKGEVLAFPGPLLSARESAVRLGIDSGSFQLEPVQTWLAGCEYAGILSKSASRWWRGRIEALVATLLEEDADFDSSIAASKISEIVKVEVAPDKCVLCEGANIARPCCLCDKAVDLSHCVVPDLSDRPSWSEPAVVCFVCISDGTADDVQFSPGAEGLVQDIREGKVGESGDDGRR